MSKEKTAEGKESTSNGISRLILIGVSLVVEILLSVMIIYFLGEQMKWVEIAIHLFAAALVLLIYSQPKTASVKMPWIVLIMALPIFGVTLYILLGMGIGTRQMKKEYAEVDSGLFPLLPENEDALKAMDKRDVRVANIVRYIKAKAGYPVYNDSEIVYFDDAAKGIEAQKEELKKAEKFIFMEYHAIENAESWQAVQEILEDRVKAGVEVRVFYDDMGSIGFINMDFVKLLESKGIRCRVFNPFIKGFHLFMNNRDHRKITVIDGKVGFTGGYNIANEYFNITHPFGHWKDTGVKITGSAVKSLTVAFLEMWNAIRGDDDNDTDYAKYLPDVEKQENASGYIAPYADLPIDNEHVGEDVYISMAEYAKDYVWYITPYLIMTDEMIHSLGLAAKRGVDVRVVTPGIPDKKLVYSVTRSYYHSLVRYGVRVYEYTPGFCHCKMSVADDTVATCGTINLDYRSLYHHFENGCLYADCGAVMDTKHDFESFMAESREVTDDYKAPTAGKNLLMLILRFIAPLL